MRISEKIIKRGFAKAEQTFDYCWNVLHDLKRMSIKEKDFTDRFIKFQERLAETILMLHEIREEIIVEEKSRVQNKSKYNFKWFKQRMKDLSIYKSGIDKIVNIAKALGDAYAYFFYQFDLDWLEEHLSHQRVINSAAGIGEKGEVEFLKKIKQIDGQFVIYHGITNILRYGDFSFIDLKQFKVVQIGELKTKKIDDNTLQLSLSLLKHKRIKVTNHTPFLKDSDLKKNRRGRQMLGIIKFLENTKKTERNINVNVTTEFYFKDMNLLYKNTKTNSTKTRQVSKGLAFSASKFGKSSLFNKIFLRNPTSVVTKETSQIQGTVIKLMKPESKNNSCIINQMLYDWDFSDKSAPGTVPIFWYPLNIELLRKLYFVEYYIIALFNPAYLIEDVQDLGFIVESKYCANTNMAEPKYFIQRFDRFISYITDHLQTESFVIDCIKEIQKHPEKEKVTTFLVKPQQRIRLHDPNLYNDNEG
jgi:hypothetical protein